MIKDLSAISTVMFPIRECEWCPAPKANIGVDPLWSSLGIHHGRVCEREVLWWEVETCDVDEPRKGNRSDRYPHPRYSAPCIPGLRMLDYVSLRKRYSNFE